MFDDMNPTVFSDRDRRWLVHILAALHNLVEDEVLFEEHAYHDPQIRDDWRRGARLATYVHALIAAGMEHTHADEAARVQAESGTLSAARLAMYLQRDASAEEHVDA